MILRENYISLRRCIEKEVLEISNQIKEGFYIPSFSSRTILYKGMVLADQVGGLGEKLGFYEDLTDKDIESSFALIHQRFSTNTRFPLGAYLNHSECFVIMVK